MGPRAQSNQRKKGRLNFQSLFLNVSMVWAIVPVLILSLYFLQVIYKTTQESAAEQLSLNTQKAALEVEQKLLKLMAEFTTLSRQVTIVRAATGSFLAHRAQEQMLDFTSRYPLVNAVFVLDKDLFTMEVVPEEGLSIDLAHITELHPLVRPLSMVDTLVQTAFFADHSELAKLNRTSQTVVTQKVLIVASPILTSQESLAQSIRLDGLLVAVIPLDRLQQAISSLSRLEVNGTTASFTVGEEVYYESAPTNPTEVVSATVPMPVPGLISKAPFQLKLAQLKSTQHAITDKAFRTSLLIIALLVAVTMITSVILSRRLVQPVRFIYQQAQKLAQGEYTTVENTMAFNEFHQIVDLMNAMSEKIKTQIAELMAIKSGLEITVAERTEELESNLTLLDKQTTFNRHLMHISAELQQMGEPATSVSHTIARLKQYPIEQRVGVILRSISGRTNAFYLDDLLGFEQDLIIHESPHLLGGDAQISLQHYAELNGQHPEVFYLFDFQGATVGFMALFGPPLLESERDSIQILVRVLGAVLQHWDLNQKLEKIANSDSLTSLANRHFFDLEFKRELAQHQRNPKYHFGVMVVDINGLKYINDNYGHECGDRLIVRVAQKLANICRREDLIARVGGDEFYILVRNADDLAAAALRGRLTLAKGGLRMDLPNGKGKAIEYNISYSLGFATTSSCPSDEIIKHADKMMYDNKAEHYARISEVGDTEG